MTDPARVTIEDPAVARAVLDALVRDATAQLEQAKRARRNGVHFRPALPPQAVFAVLSLVADVPAPTVGSANGTTPGSVSPEINAMVPVRVAADLVGKSESYTRRLVRLGQVRGRKTAGVWLVDTDSIKAVIGRTTT